MKIDPDPIDVGFFAAYVSLIQNLIENWMPNNKNWPQFKKLSLKIRRISNFHKRRTNKQTISLDLIL